VGRIVNSEEAHEYLAEISGNRPLTLAQGTFLQDADSLERWDSGSRFGWFWLVTDNRDWNRFHGQARLIKLTTAQNRARIVPAEIVAALFPLATREVSRQ
jgi:hypothetical protein